MNNLGAGYSIPTQRATKERSSKDHNYKRISSLFLNTILRSAIAILIRII